MSWHRFVTDSLRHDTRHWPADEFSLAGVISWRTTVRMTRPDRHPWAGGSTYPEDCLDMDG